MLKSLYSGIAGLKVNQQKLDVIGNNVANVGTTSFKGSSVNFQNTLSQSISSAQGASTNLGGINASQIGLGVKIGAIAINESQGSMTPTGSDTDLAINGNGYFMVENGPAVNTDASILVNNTTSTATTAPFTPAHGVDNTIGSQISYTRDGSFTRDDQGNLVTSSGLRVLGYSVQSITLTGTSAAAPTFDTATSQSIDANGVNFVDANGKYAAVDTNLKTMVIPDSVITSAPSATPVVTSKVTKISIDSNGIVTANLADNSSTIIGQIAMASFNNPAGLKDAGGNLYQATTNSGIAVIKSGAGNVKDDNSGGGAYGTVNSGYLEASNVDLAQQFTDMIVTTRAFEANGKTISNGDEILQTIIALKR